MMKIKTWSSHRLVVPGHVGYILAVDQDMMTLEEYAGLAGAMTEAALAYLRDNDLVIETKPEPVPDNVVHVDFGRKQP